MSPVKYGTLSDLNQFFNEYCEAQEALERPWSQRDEQLTQLTLTLSKAFGNEERAVSKHLLKNASEPNLVTRVCVAIVTSATQSAQRWPQLTPQISGAAFAKVLQHVKPEVERFTETLQEVIRVVESALSRRSCQHP